MELLARWVISAIALLLVAYLLPGIEVDGFGTALIVALVLGFVNAFVRPVLVLLTLPITVITLGLFILVINALMFWFVASFIEGFAVSGFGSAFLGALVLSLLSWMANSLIRSAD